MEKNKTENEEIKKIIQKIINITPKYLQFIFILSIILCVVGVFTFNMTYTKEYNFFSYDLFSLNNLWLWGIAVLYAIIIFTFIALPFNILVCMRKKIIKKDKFLLACSIFIVILYGAIFFYLIYLAFKQPYTMWLSGFYFIGSLVCFVVIDSLNKFYQTRNKGKLFMVVVLIVPIYFMTIFMYYKSYSEAFKVFLTSRNLASDLVEIYLQKKNKFVYGRLIFKDNKNAFVEFEDFSNECNCTRVFKTSVPINDVSILSNSFSNNTNETNKTKDTQ